MVLRELHEKVCTVAACKLTIGKNKLSYINPQSKEKERCSGNNSQQSKNYIRLCWLWLSTNPTDIFGSSTAKRDGSFFVMPLHNFGSFIFLPQILFKQRTERYCPLKSSVMSHQLQLDLGLFMQKQMKLLMYLKLGKHVRTY